MSPRILRLPAAAFLLVTLFPLLLEAQNRDEWSVFSAVNVTRDVAFDRAGKLWIATTGGVVSYDSLTGEYDYFRTTEGLLRLNSTAVDFDPTTGYMYVGSDDGSISILKNSGEWKYATEIAGATERAERRINGFGFRDNRVYILTAFGIALYNPLDSTVVESYQQFGSIPQYTSVNDMLFWHDSIWVATSSGLAVAPAEGKYLAFPDAWRSYGRDSNLVSANIRSLAIADDRLLIGTADSGAFTYEAGRFSRRFDLPTTQGIMFASSEAGVAAASAFTLHRYIDGAFRPQPVGVPQLILALDIDSDGTLGLGIALFLEQIFSFGVTDGITMIHGDPNSPHSNSFLSLARGDDGSIWTTGEATKAVSRLVDGQWEKYFPKMPDGSLPKAMAVNRGANGSIWVGTDPGGFTRFTPTETGVDATRYDASNSRLTSVSGDPKRVVGLGAAADESGRTWLVNWDPLNQGPVLHVQLRADEIGGGSEFESFSTTALRNYWSIVVDQSGIKWLGSAGDASKPQGLLWYDDNGTVTDRTDDRSGFVYEADGLPSGLQTALAIDRDGMIWIGSPKGPAYLANPGSVARNGDQPSIQKIRPLVDVPVNAIAIDALNRKWIGTNRGVYLLSADGTEVLTHYTTTNSPLVDDGVQSLLADDATGDIYIGTASGLSRISTAAVRPETPAGPVSVSPHPFLLPADEPLRISGLPESASIKILSLSGSLVRELQSPGGAIAFWDGRDTAGAPVPTGIYIVAAGASPGEETVVGKIAVLRR